MEVTLLILALNEEEPLRSLLPALRRLLAQEAYGGEILVIDGGSTDCTVQVCNREGARVVVQKDSGYGAAFREGIACARGRFIVTVDADLSHRVEDVQRLVSQRQQADVLIGSRYVPAGRYRGKRGRYLLSHLLNCAVRALLGLRIADTSSGLRLYRRELLSGLALKGRSFDVLQEVLVKLLLRGARIREIPITFEGRPQGSSKVRYLPFAWSYLRTLWTLHRLLHSQRIVR